MYHFRSLIRYHHMRQKSAVCAQIFWRFFYAAKTKNNAILCPVCYNEIIIHREGSL